MSIRQKILLGCLSLTMLTIIIGVGAQYAERRLGDLGLGIYDNAFMGMSYLRSAQVSFADIAAHPEKAASAFDMTDLDVARDRAMSLRGKAEVQALEDRLRATLPKLKSDPTLAEPVQEAFERVVETFADDGFVYRRDVSRLISAEITQTNAFLGVSVMAALAITLLIGRSIVPPILRAVSFAQSIAAGRLDETIETKGRSETADLLRALKVMQDSIRGHIAQQEERHADALAVQNLKLDAALQNMNQGLCLFDRDGVLSVANRRFAEMFGAPTLGDGADAVFEAAGLSPLIGVIHDDMVVERLSCELPDGRVIAVSQQAIAGGGWVATYEDVTERRAAEARLAHMARHDVLTGLPNRLLLSEHLPAALTRTRGNGNLAMLCLDLDRFKVVNDTLDHAAGDLVLAEVAKRLISCTRQGDLVVRMGGDEFAVVQEAAGQPAGATRLARRLVDVLTRPFDVQGQQVMIGTSIGIALADTPGINSENLLKSADLALYRAKSEGRGHFRFFEAEMDLQIQARRALELDLRRALAEEQFEVYYQPLMAADGGVSGFEALARWRHPERGMISPAEFIPIAEETGLVVELGLWVLRRACRDCASWQSSLKVAVNLSVAQFRGNTLRHDVADALTEAALPASRLELEITESLLLQDDSNILETLHAIRALGVRISMDDFGTGYSSLSYLRRFPFDKIKIDQSFVQGMVEQEDCRAIVRAVIGLGRSLGIAVNAEGVETTDQLDALRAEGCGELQGYFFSRPHPFESVEEVIRRHGVAASGEEPRLRSIV